MRLYLSADIEGTCGIDDWAETERATMDDYRPFAAQMTAEVAAACEGAVAAGAEDILVKDAHDSARNLDAARLPRQARVLRGWTGDPLCMMAGLERGAFGGVLFTGYHAWGCCGGNPLSHTMTTACDQVTLNGVPASEFLINAYTALYFGVPVAFLSGDRELCAFAQDWLPGLVAVPVNEGRGGGVLSMHPQAAAEAIRAGAEEAVRRLRAGGAASSARSCWAAERMTSIYTNLSQATMKGLGVFFSPMPYTFLPASRRRMARRVKSLSLDTSTKPSTWPV